jgi:biopolymer transport protein TolQ
MTDKMIKLTKIYRCLRPLSGVGRSAVKSLLLVMVSLSVIGWGRPALADSKTIAQAASNGERSNAGGASGGEVSTSVQSEDISSPGVFSRAWQAGIVVFMTLLLLISASIASWVIIVTKWKDIGKINVSNDAFVKSFWESRSLNDLNGRLQDYKYSPAREVFRSGYAELARSNQMRDQTFSSEIAIGAAMDNLNRTLQKAKLHERKRLEHNIHWLANIASVAPFVGLFGTVWGIMNSFEGIARTGSASLAAVAPGIAEALISTAFGLAAAIPAVVGYNLFNGKLRFQMMSLDGFCADFLNIVERYLVTEKSKVHDKV